VTAGLLNARKLAGYGDHPVYVRNAAHVPPPVVAVLTREHRALRRIRCGEHAAGG
jgi:hypothetical protein